MTKGRQKRPALSSSFCCNDFKIKSLFLYPPCMKRCLGHLYCFSGQPSVWMWETMDLDWIRQSGMRQSLPHHWPTKISNSFFYFFNSFSFLAHETYSPLQASPASAAAWVYKAGRRWGYLHCVLVELCAL